jgi:hypothetical protein
MLWRHGDVLIAQTPSIPEPATHFPGSILVRGEATGHSHHIGDPTTAEIWIARNREMYLKVLSSTRILHEEHGPITLPPGNYRVWQQREYTPQKVRPVFD